MPELTFRSAGVSAREIDLSGPSNVAPVGVPAGIIGTAMKGPAFVPITVGTFKDWMAKYGETDGEMFGPLAVNEWLSNAQALSYVRVLGIGDGKKRTTSGNNAGKVTRAGFVVGDNQVRDSGLLGRNTYAVDNGPPGRVHFLGAFMSESAGSTVFSDAGIQNSISASAIIRGVLMAASGVVPMLSGTIGSDSGAPTTAVATAAGPAGGITGSVDLSAGKQEFVLLLNGHIPTTQYPSVITASMDVDAPNYFPNVLNTDPLLLQQTGHYLYTRYDIHPALAVVTGTGLYVDTAPHIVGGDPEPSVFITTASLSRNSGSITIPNFESFEDRFQTPFSPFVVSQKFGGQSKNLFRIHALDDGVYANNKFKISIRNIAKSNSERDQYGTFDLLVRDFDDTDDDPIIIEQFFALSLNPGADRYIAKVIGDQHFYFDFDKNTDGQKLVLDGNFPNVSNLIRVEMDSSVDDGEVDQTALPVGFRGPHHLVTSGSGILTSPAVTGTIHQDDVATWLDGAVVPPIPFRETVTFGVEPKLSVGTGLYWGVQFARKVSVSEPNKSLVVDPTIESFTKYFPKFHTVWQNPWVGNNNGVADVGGTVLDSDRFNNNLFSLENVQVRTGSDGVADAKEWTSASYVRAGNISANDTNKTRAFNVALDLGDSTAKTHAKFTFFVQGGFDGVRIFDEQSAKLTNTAVSQEMDDASRGQDEGATVSAYKKALDIMGERSEVDIKLLAIPGIRHEVITDQAITTTEERFDAMFIMDIEERDTLNSVVTSSLQEINVGNTVTSFANRNLDTSFAAAYFPDQIITDPGTNTNVQVPPSVVVLGAFALNDAVAHPWFAPAGFTRGPLASSIDTAVRLNRANLDALYDVDINPITSFPGSGGPVVWGQKTLQSVQSSLDRVNVRRLLIEIRRQVRQVANRLIFEPNREATLAKFESLVRPKLQRIQELQGVDRFKVQIDTTTTTQADVENNTVRGQIFVQPTRVAEFISLDFVVTNAGADV